MPEAIYTKYKTWLAEYIHITNYELRALLSDIYNISEEDELWLEKYYKTAYKLLEKDSFQTAVHTMASYRWHSVPRVQLAVIWSGIESLFNVNTEVTLPEDTGLSLPHILGLGRGIHTGKVHG